jgi:hypothetical protein
MQNYFTTRDNRYPKNHQQTLHLLDKYSKTVVAKVTRSEGTSFAQKSGRGGGNRGSNGNVKGHDSSTYDKPYWKDKECYKCHKKGHPATHCPKNPSDDDDRSTASTDNSVKKLKKDLKSINKAFTMVNTQLTQLKEADSARYVLQLSTTSRTELSLRYSSLSRRCTNTIFNVVSTSGRYMLMVNLHLSRP